MTTPLNQHFHPGTIYTADIVALGTIIGTFAGYLPTIAAGMAALWYFIAIVDSIGRWFKKD